MFDLKINCNKLEVPNTSEIGINSFSALRFFCCIVVILGHCMDLSHSDLNLRKYIDMHISVCVFFILSGFWVTKSLLSSKSIKEYVFKRLKRLLPLYYLTVFLFAVICFYYSDYDVKQYFSHAELYKYLFWNSIFLNFISPSLPGVFNNNAINGALWTIKVEIGFYIILPVLIYYLRKLNSTRKRNGFLITIYILSVLWNGILNYFAGSIPILKQLSYQLPGFMSFFVMGILFFLNWNKLISMKNYYIFPAIIIFGFHYITKTEILMPIALTCIIMWAGKTLLFLNKIGSPIDYSYGMYLFHYPIINIFVFFGFFSYSFVWAAISVVSVSFLMSFTSEKYIQSNIK